MHFAAVALLVSPALVGLSIAVTRGTGQPSSQVRLSWPWALVALPAIALLPTAVHYLGVDERTGFRTASTIEVALVCAFVWRNWVGFPDQLRLWTGISVTGVLANAVPRVVLGDMPFSESAARAAGYPSGFIAQHHAGHIPLSTVSSGWWPISDVIPVPGLGRVLSIGDLLLIVGVGGFIGCWLRMRIQVGEGVTR